jgi:hypothetical protein
MTQAQWERRERAWLAVQFTCAVVAMLSAMVLTLI